MPLSDIPQGSRVFVDVNIFLYSISNHPTHGNACKTFLQRIERGELEGFVSVEVLNEMLFRLVIGEVANNQRIRLQESTRYIKRNPNVLRSLTAYQAMSEVENMPNVQVLGVEPDDFRKARDIMQQHLLLSNDSLHIAVMQRNGLNTLASNDGDFQRVPWIKLYRPGKV